jgi:cell division protein FtsX
VYLLKLAFRPWRMALWSQLFSALAVGVLLLLVAFLFWMQQGLKTVIQQMQEEQVMTAYLDPSLDAGAEEKLVKSVQALLGSEKAVEIQLVSTSQFIDRLRKSYSDLARQVEELSQDAPQIVPRYITISGVLPTFTAEKLREIQGIESVESSKDRYHHIVGAFSVLRWIARMLIAGICFALVTGLIHLSRMNAYLHGDALALLKLWGAGVQTITYPGMISGSLVGFLGGGLAAMGWATLGVWFSSHIRSISTLLRELPQFSVSLALFLLVLGVGIGAVAGLFGTLFNPQVRGERGI